MQMVKALKSEDVPLPREAAEGFSMPAIRKVNVAGQDILVTRLGTGEAVAFAAHCPHQGTPLDRAVLVGDQLRCAQHNYVYDPVTGHNVRPSLNANSDALFRLKPGYLPTFAVQEKEGWIWVSHSPNPRPSGPPPRPAPPPSRHIPPPMQDKAPSKERLSPETVTLGKALELTLSSKPEPGHLWRMESDLGVVSLAGQIFDGDANVYRLTLVGEKPGADTVRLIFGKPWGGQHSKILSLDIEVHQPGD